MGQNTKRKFVKAIAKCARNTNLGLICFQFQQQKVSLYTQALSIMSRVYIGSINFDIGEEHLRQVFGPYGPVKLINMCRDPSTGVSKWEQARNESIDCDLKNVTEF